MEKGKLVELKKAVSLAAFSEQVHVDGSRMLNLSPPILRERRYSGVNRERNNILMSSDMPDNSSRDL